MTTALVPQRRLVPRIHPRLQIQGEAAAFREELRLEGVRVLHDNGRGELRVAVPPGWTTRAFFALAANHGVVVRGLLPDDEALEELFHRVLAGTDAAPDQDKDARHG